MSQTIEFQHTLTCKIDHGDYKRISRLVKKEDGKPYTADYVRKVLLGKRSNKRIHSKAKEYLMRKAQLNKELED